MPPAKVRVWRNPGQLAAEAIRKAAELYGLDGGFIVSLESVSATPERKVYQGIGFKRTFRVTLIRAKGGWVPSHGSFGPRKEDFHFKPDSRTNWRYRVSR